MGDAKETEKIMVNRKIKVREQTEGTMEELVTVIKKLDELDFLFDVEKLKNSSVHYGLCLGQGEQRFKITIYQESPIQVTGHESFIKPLTK